MRLFIKRTVYKAIKNVAFYFTFPFNFIFIK